MLIIKYLQTTAAPVQKVVCHCRFIFEKWTQSTFFTLWAALISSLKVSLFIYVSLWRGIQAEYKCYTFSQRHVRSVWRPHLDNILLTWTAACGRSSKEHKQLKCAGKCVLRKQLHRCLVCKFAHVQRNKQLWISFWWRGWIFTKNPQTWHESYQLICMCELHFITETGSLWNHGSLSPL